MYYIDVGEYLFKLKSVPKPILQHLKVMYGKSLLTESERPADFIISLKSQSYLRKLIKPQVTFSLGSHTPFKPLSLAHSYPILEWGMNWCIAATDFNHLLIHAAVLVKEGKAIIFPATPGSGKSTLSAYFSLTGWDLYSDELAIIDLESMKVKPIFRPVCLKNGSIDLVKSWFPETIFTSTALGTSKGNIAHLKVNDFSHFKSFAPVSIKAIVFPKYRESNSTEAFVLDKIEGFERLAANAFNYNILGLKAFDSIHKLIEGSEQFEINYSELSEVSDLLTRELIFE